MKVRHLDNSKPTVSRRSFLSGSALGVAGLAGATMWGCSPSSQDAPASDEPPPFRRDPTGAPVRSSKKSRRRVHLCKKSFCRSHRMCMHDRYIDSLHTRGHSCSKSRFVGHEILRGTTDKTILCTDFDALATIHISNTFLPA